MFWPGYAFEQAGQDISNHTGLKTRFATVTQPPIRYADTAEGDLIRYKRFQWLYFVRTPHQIQGPIFTYLHHTYTHVNSDGKKTQENVLYDQVLLGPCSAFA